MVDENDSIEELKEKAKIIAEATGRTEGDVLADLLDDGIVNLSNESPKESLVDQLKEAAELISTVQNINKEVSENTVLNGGENSTEIKVETTLEGDVVDRAIEAVQRKADNLKKLIITLAPVFILLTGGGMEAFGIIDIFGNDGEDYDDDYYEIWGCTAPDAENYMPDATIDDGSCWWDDNHGGGGGPPHQPCDWEWQDNSYTDDNNPDSLFIGASFSSFQCPHEMHGDFRMILFKDGEFYDEEIDTNMKFYENQDLGHEFSDLQEGDYTIKFRFDTYDGSNWNWDSPRNYYIESQEIYGCTDSEATNYDSSATDDDGSCEYPPEEPCTVEIQNHYRGHVGDDAEQDAILIAFKVAPTDCEGENIKIDIDLYQNGYDVNYTHYLIVSGDDFTDVSHIFDGVQIGNGWIPRITASLDGEVLEQVWFWAIDVVEQEPETCEINLFDIQLITNNTTATVGFDLDCGYDTNDLEGYNVSVQFLVYHLNETNQGANGTGPIEWTTQVYYIEGYADDVRVLVLDNFTVENITHYDFYWYAIWTDADGEQQFLEETWLNRELEA